MIEARAVLGPEVAAGQRTVVMQSVSVNRHAEVRLVTTYNFYYADGSLIGKKTIEDDSVIWTDEEGDAIEDPDVVEIRKVVLADVRNTTGLSREELDTAIESIDVNVETGNVNVIFKENRVPDASGSDELPQAMTYELITFEGPDVDGNLTTSYELGHVRIKMRKDSLGEIVNADVNFDVHGDICKTKWFGMESDAVVELYRDQHSYEGSEIFIQRPVPTPEVTTSLKCLPFSS